MKRFTLTLPTLAMGLAVPLATAEPVDPPDLSFDASNPGNVSGVWDDEQGALFEWSLGTNASLIEVTEADGFLISKAYSNPSATGTTSDNSVPSAAIVQGTPLVANDDVTLEFLIRTDALNGSNQTLFETGGGNGAALTVRPRSGDFDNGTPDADEDDRFIVGWRVDDKAGPKSIGENPGDEARSTYIQESQLGQWTHITAVLDRSSGLTLYLDGQSLGWTYDFPLGETVDNWTGSNGAGLGTIEVGAATFSFGDFTGDIAAARLYQEALSEDQVETLYQNALIPEPGSAALMTLCSLALLRRSRRDR